MADDDPIAIPVSMRVSEARAVASILKRMDCATVHGFASPLAAYAGKSEGDLAWSGLTVLTGALSSVGRA